MKTYVDSVMIIARNLLTATDDDKKCLDFVQALFMVGRKCG